MKRSFYQVLDVQPDADREQLDAAYARVTRALGASKHGRGTVESTIEWNLLQDGYHILSHPVRRARYDAKLAAEASSRDVVLLPQVERARRKLRLELVAIVAISVVLGGLIYSEMEQKVDEVRLEHRQAVARKKEEQTRPVILDSTRSATSSGNRAPEPTR